MDEVKDWIGLAREELAQLDVDEIKQSGVLPGGGKQFFPVIGYPPLTMFSEMDDTALFENFEQRPANKTIAYGHIPFCPSRCTFCHWITKTKTKAEEVDVYLDHLEQEMSLYRSKMGMDSIPTSSVLIGGGTPTYLNPKQMERFLKNFTRHFDLSDCTQFSIEAEPTTLLGKEGLEKLAIMKDYGVHRISLGVQSFDDHVLSAMGRTHNNTDTMESIEQMRRAGIENVFIDLIYAYPGQTVEQWVQNMLTAINLDIEGYQLYRLRIRPHGDRDGNILKVHTKAPEKFPEPDDIQLMKYLGIMMSEKHGYGEHQTRIFARKANDISHYLRDWACDLADVAGVGVSSWSNLRGVFSMNVGDANLENYYKLVREGKVSVNRGKIRSADDERRRCFILPLKNARVSKQTFTERTGETVEQCFSTEINVFKSLGLIEENDSHVWLTPRGRFFADEISTQFFDPNYLPFPDVTRVAEMA
ncbi:MAG: coproporphyrinogen III oxidase family protein [Ectothiorhodospiraceae bacterium]|nr:coproporphyrinogen III oxidase family protein [Ectothiorhodospiraceae bacterium]